MSTASPFALTAGRPSGRPPPPTATRTAMGRRASRTSELVAAQHLDRRLLLVTGFDSAAPAFRYRVHQRCGAASGPLHPFRISSVVSLRARLATSARRG